jgi:hypothetical protein
VCAKGPGNVALPVQDAENADGAGLNAIKDQIVARWMAADAGANILVSLPADMGRRLIRLHVFWIESRSRSAESVLLLSLAT